MLNESMYGPSYEIIATDLSIKELRKTKWGARIKTL